jgi:hypothetical protein
MYLQCPLKESRTAIIVYFVLCLLYVLSMATVASDFLNCILVVSNNSICKIIIMQMRIGALFIALVSKLLTVNNISRGDCPNRSKWFL